ncbi:MAG TPA: hypothetical protein VLV89_10525 [Candidatus Acidoferrum sp.]|nr:hypothetical protein [Candidatus Acidoferrum sp.]
MKNILIAVVAISAAIFAVVMARNSMKSSASPYTASGLPSAGNTPSTTVAMAADLGSLKTVEIVDPLFNMVAYTLQIPTSWQFEGTVLHGPGCIGDYAGTAFRAYSPDMRYGIQLVPVSYFYWADDERAIPKGANCKDLPPMSAATYGNLVSIKMRPGSEVDSVEPAPSEAEFQASIEKMNASLAASARSMGNPNPARYKGEVSRLHIHYLLDGRPEEELLNVSMSVGDQPTSVNVAPPGQVMRLAMKNAFISNATLVGMRTPQGQMEANKSALEAISKSFKVNPEYQTRFAAYIQDRTNRAIAASWQTFHTMIQQSNEQMAQMRANAQQAIRNMEAQGDARRANFNAAMERKSAHAQDVCDYLLDQQYYLNPTTGKTQTQSSGYDHTFSDGGRGVIQTNSPTYNPNGMVQGNWTELQPIHH